MGAYWKPAFHILAFFVFFLAKAGFLTIFIFKHFNHFLRVASGTLCHPAIAAARTWRCMRGVLVCRSCKEMRGGGRGYLIFFRTNRKKKTFTTLLRFSMYLGIFYAHSKNTPIRHARRPYPKDWTFSPFFFFLFFFWFITKMNKSMQR